MRRVSSGYAAQQHVFAGPRHHLGAAWAHRDGARHVPKQTQLTCRAEDVLKPLFIAAAYSHETPTPAIQHEQRIKTLQNTYTFPAILHYADDGISIRFPDLPGCTSCSDTTDEAVRDAKEALGLHLWGMEKDCDEIPSATPIDKLTLAPNETPLLVEVFMPAVRARIQRR